MVDCFRVIVRDRDRHGASQAHPLARARMHEQVVDDQVCRLWQSRENGQIRGVAAAEVEHSRGPEDGCGLDFQGLMLRMVAAQQAGTAGAHRDAVR